MIDLEHTEVMTEISYDLISPKLHSLSFYLPLRKARYFINPFFLCLFFFSEIRYSQSRIQSALKGPLRLGLQRCANKSGTLN